MIRLLTVSAIEDCKSTETSKTDEAALALPAASVSVAVKLCVPLARVPVVKFQSPLLSAVALPSKVAPSKTLTALLAPAVPVRATSFVLTIASLVI